MAGTTRRITERVADPFAGCRVDRAAGVIFNVKLCGLSSDNGRDYLPEMFRRDHGKYAEALIYFNHDRERRVENIAGRIKNPRVDADGTPRGDAHLDLDHKDVPRVLRWAEEDPTRVGFSHVADCKLTYPNGRETVEALEYVESVDIVAQPATVGGLFEGRGNGGRTVATVKEYLDKLAPKCGVDQLLKVRLLLKEDDFGSAPMMDAAPPAEEAGAEDGITAAVKAAAQKEIDDCLANSSDPATIKRCLARLKKILGLHGDLSDEDLGTEPDETPPGEKTEESKKGKKAITTPTAPAVPDFKTLVKECREEGFRDFTDIDLTALTAFDTVADRKAYIREQKARVKEERPQSTGRDRLATLDTEQETAVRVAEAVNGKAKKDEKFEWVD